MMITAIIALAASRPLLAGPPFATDDPVPVEYRHWEFYLASQFSRSGGERAGTLPHAEINYGILPETQVHLIAPMEYVKGDYDEETRYGYGSTEAGVKLRLLREGGWYPQVATFPLVLLPTDSPRIDPDPKTRYFFNIWMQKGFDAWTSYGGGGYWINPGAGNRNFWFFGWLLQRQVTERLALGGEITWASPDTEGADPVSGWNLGGVWDLTGNLHLLFSGGTTFTRPRETTGYLACQVTI